MVDQVEDDLKELLIWAAVIKHGDHDFEKSIT